jgi:hypothetical protein
VQGKRGVSEVCRGDMQMDGARGGRANDRFNGGGLVGDCVYCRGGGEDDDLGDIKKCNNPPGAASDKGRNVLETYCT